MIPAGTAVSTAKAIAARYRVGRSTVANWTAHPDFPEASGSPRRRTYPDARVDAWVKQHRFALWRAANGEPFVSTGDPADLLDVREFAHLRAQRTGRAPASPGAMMSYVSRRQIPAPDRAPDDGKTPTVAAYMWLRSTVDAHVSSLKGPGNRTNHPGPRARTAGAAAG